MNSLGVVVSTLRAAPHGAQLQRVLPTLSSSAAPAHASLIDVSKPVVYIHELLFLFNAVLTLGRKVVKWLIGN